MQSVEDHQPLDAPDFRCTFLSVHLHPCEAILEIQPFILLFFLRGTMLPVFFLLTSCMPRMSRGNS